MNAAEYWQVFLETGAPEMYLLYNQAKRMEEAHVPDNTSVGAAYHRIQ